jgi:hypothetical protein
MNAYFILSLSGRRAAASNSSIHSRGTVRCTTGF